MQSAANCNIIIVKSINIYQLGIHSVLLYGADSEAWVCIGRMDALDQLQMRAHRIFFGACWQIPSQGCIDAVRNGYTLPL